ncbi:MAG: VWA domain-containing protein [Myxococcota bacterium]
MEFEQVRDYYPGDDVRHIDWNVTLPVWCPFYQEHREERELTVMLLVDVSLRGHLAPPTSLRTKSLRRLPPFSAYTAIKSNDRVGLIVFSDRIEHYIPPKKGRAHVWRVIRDILTHKPENRSTDLEGALDYLRKVVRRRCVAFLISDFLDQELNERLQVTAGRHDMICYQHHRPSRN